MGLLRAARQAMSALAGHGAPPMDPELASLLPWALEQVDPRLAGMSGLGRAHADALAQGWGYCRRLAGDVPGPLRVDAQSFARDPLVHALFGSAEGIAQALTRSRAVRDWLRDRPGAQSVYALLGARRQERQVLGMTVSQGVLQREVPQTVSYFTDHTFSNLAPTEAEARALLARQFLASLLARVAERLGETRERRRVLERERDELRGRLRGRPGDAALRAELDEILGRLGALIRDLEPNSTLAHFEAVLRRPENHLQIHERAVRMDAMGVCQVLGAAVSGCETREVHLREMVCRDRRLWNVFLVSCPLDMLPSYPQRLEREERWLTI